MADDHTDDHTHRHLEASELGEMDARVRALETLLVERGLIDPDALDKIVETYEHEVGPHRGAQVVARSWTDPEFRAWLLRDASAAVAAMGYAGRQGEHLTALENTPERHNLVVCTLCSCYPWPILGLPPVWYKSPAYRAKAVRDPRGVLADFGVELPATTSIRVWDSTSEQRYLVVPMRPEGTDGWTVAELAGVVTRDSMVGTGLASNPGAQANPRVDNRPAAGARGGSG